METMFKLMAENEERRRRADAEERRANAEEAERCRRAEADERREERREAAEREDRRAERDRREAAEKEDRRAKREEKRHQETLQQMQQQQQLLFQAQISQNGNNNNNHANGFGTKPPPCDDFTGESKITTDNDFTVWLKRYEQAAALMGYDPAQKLQWLQMKLKGLARITADTLSDVERLDWEAVTSLLKKRFQDDTTATVKYRRLFDRRMESGETNRLLFTDIQRLAREATSKEPLNDTVLVKHVFVSALPTPARTHVALEMKDDDTAEKVFERAQHFQTIIQENRSKPVRTVTAVEVEEAEDEVNAVWNSTDQSRLVQGRKPTDQQNSGARQPFNGVSQRFSDTGQQYNGVRRFQNFPNRSVYNRHEFCDYCKRQGHTIFKCRSQEWQQQEKSRNEEESTDRKSAPMDQKPPMVSICSPVEPIAPEARGSTWITTSITDSCHNSVFGEISLEGVSTSALLDTGSSLIAS